MAWKRTRRVRRWMKLKSNISVDIGGEDAETCFVCSFLYVHGGDYNLLCRRVTGLFLGRMCRYGTLGTRILSL